jgi:hypothetical protein
VRLRPLTEAECYARCYGGRRDESVSVVSREPLEQATLAGEAEGLGAVDPRERREAA